MASPPPAPSAPFSRRHRRRVASQQPLPVAGRLAHRVALSRLMRRSCVRKLGGGCQEGASHPGDRDGGGRAFSIVGCQGGWHGSSDAARLGPSLQCGIIPLPPRSPPCPSPLQLRLRTAFAVTLPNLIAAIPALRAAGITPRSSGGGGPEITEPMVFAWMPAAPHLSRRRLFRRLRRPLPRRPRHARRPAPTRTRLHPPLRPAIPRPSTHPDIPTLDSHRS